MTKVRPLSTPERIARVFNTLTEVHRRAIQATLRITPEEFDNSIARARDLGAEFEPRLRITPVYERDGWWTAEPTRRIAGIAVHETLKRHTGESVRHARVYADFGELSSFTRYHTSLTEAAVTSFLTEMSEIDVSPGLDYVLDRIDVAEDLGHLWVPRNEAAAA